MVRRYLTLVFVATCVITVGFGVAILRVLWSDGDNHVGANLVATAALLFLISRVVVGMSRARRGR